MSDITAERHAAAAERAAFYEAAGIEPGELITTSSRLAFSPIEERKDWRQLSDKPAIPTQQFARRPNFPGALHVSRGDFNGQERAHFTGVASVTDTPYTMCDWMGEYNEVVARSAFTATLATDPDVPFLANHSGMTMARTKNGTLVLTLKDDGLHCDAYCNLQRYDVDILYRAVQDGEVNEMSFAFLLEEGRWSEDYTQFTITKLDIHRGDVSAVNLGANPYTHIEARTQEILRDLRSLSTVAARKAQQILEGRTDIEKADRLADAFARLDREEDAIRNERSNLVKGEEPVGRSVETLAALLAIDEAELEMM